MAILPGALIDFGLLKASDDVNASVSSFENKFRIVQDTFELEDYFPEPSEVLLPSTLEMQSEDRAYVTDAILVCRDGTHNPCQIRASASDLLVSTVRYSHEGVHTPADMKDSQTRKRVILNDVKGETQDYIFAHCIQAVLPRHGSYGASDIEIRFYNGSGIVLLEVADSEALSKVRASMYAMFDRAKPFYRRCETSDTRTSSSTRTFQVQHLRVRTLLSMLHFSHVPCPGLLRRMATFEWRALCYGHTLLASAG